MNVSQILLAAISRADIATYVDSLFIVYIILVFTRILLSWIPRIPYNRVLQAVVDFVHQTVDPFLRVFRNLLPPLGGGGMAFDLSPMLATFVLLIGRSIVVGAIN